ncbi:GNAT family N-acetyltransferase [Rhizobium mayense]|uniref:GNAT family N-acetyltransferase n=1 Tax=Rhizobium mayense TaxID=1312184 RepID=UPI0032E4F338
MIAHGFDDIGLHRLEANVQPANHASIALVQRLGFRKEGFSPKYLRIGGASGAIMNAGHCRQMIHGFDVQHEVIPGSIPKRRASC